MNTRRFGPLAWAVLQTTPRVVLPDDDTDGGGGDAGSGDDDAARESLNVFYQALPNVLPCRWCRSSCARYVECIDARKWLQRPSVLRRATVEYWLYLLHNLVNQKLDKRWYTEKAEVYDGAVSASRDAYLCALLEWLTVVACDLPEQLLVAKSPPGSAAAAAVGNEAAVVTTEAGVRDALRAWAAHVTRGDGATPWLDAAKAHGESLATVVGAHIAYAHAAMRRRRGLEDDDDDESPPPPVTDRGAQRRRRRRRRGFVHARPWARVAWAIVYLEHVARLLRAAPDATRAPMGAARIALVCEQPRDGVWQRRRHALADALHALVAERADVFATRDGVQRALHDVRAAVFADTCCPFAQAQRAVVERYAPRAV